MTLSSKLAFYSSLILLLWITIPPECSSKSLNAPTGAPPDNSTTLDPMSYEAFLQDMRILDEQIREFQRRNIKISEEGEVPVVYLDTETNETWSWSPSVTQEKSFLRRVAEFVSRNATMIIAFCLVVVIAIVFIEVLRHFVNRLDEEDEYGRLITVNIPKMARM